MGWRKKTDNVPRRRRLTDEQSAARQTERTADQRPGSNLFRRNRTLIGSLSPSVSSANELGGDLRSPRAHVHHLTAHRRRLSSILVFVLVGVGALTWFLYEFTAGVQVVANENSIAIKEDTYRRAINDYFASRPVERLRSLLNEQQLGMYLSSVTPEVEAARATGTAGIAKSQIEITFRRPVAGWLFNGKQYFVDKHGVSFQTNYFERPTVKISDESGVPQSAGTAVASSRFLHFVGRSVELARGYGLVVERAVIPPNATREIELRLGGHKYPIKLSLDRPVAEQIEDMQRAVAYFDGRKMNPQYVDVRVSGKAYYK